MRSFGALFVAIAASFSLHLLADDSRFLADRAHFEAMEQSRNCSIYRNLNSQFTSEIESLQAAVKKRLAHVRASWNSLSACGVQLGLNDPKREQAALAEICPQRYRRWVKLSFRAQSAAGELKSAYQATRRLGGEIARKCPSLDTVVESASDEPPLESDEVFDELLDS